MHQELCSSAPELSVTTAHELASAGLGIIVDVREPWELEFHPSAPGAERLPLFTVRAFCGQPVADEDISEEPLADLDTTMATLITMMNRHAHEHKIILCLCRTGRRSLEAVQLLRNLGYCKAVNIAGGIMAWEAAGLPVGQPEPS